MPEPTGNVYSDLSNTFQSNEKGKLSRVFDLEAVQQSLETIMLTPLGSRKFLPTFGTTLSSLLFEPISLETAIIVKNEIRAAINKWEPRIIIRRLEVIPDYDNNALFINVAGFVPGLREFEFSRSITLEDV